MDNTISATLAKPISKEAKENELEASIDWIVKAIIINSDQVFIRSSLTDKAVVWNSGILHYWDNFYLDTKA